MMFFTERDEGDYRIYGGAIESARGDGYIAAVVIQHDAASDGRAREVFRDDALACGHRWSSPKAALSYAMGKGVQMVRLERGRLACRDAAKSKREA